MVETGLRTDELWAAGAHFNRIIAGGDALYGGRDG